MKKRILSLALVVALVAIMLTSFTLAYFTDTTDVATNTMTFGDAAITQYEKDKEGKDFVQDQILVPMVDNRADKEANPIVDGWYDEDMKNVIDKVVTVSNDGENSVYVRTIFAFEGRSDVQAVYIGRLKDADWTFEYLPRAGEDSTAGPNGEVVAREVMIDGVVHTLYVATYEHQLAKGETSDPSLKQFFLSPDVTQDMIESFNFGDKYTIYAVSQAVQVAGFDTTADELANAKAALNEAFGDPATVSDAVVAGWFN